MPRGVSRLKHPELYAGEGNSGKKSTKVGTGRRVKTGGRTRNVENFSGSSGSTNGGNSELFRLQTLATIRQAFTGNQTGINPEIIGKLDQVIGSEIDRLVQNNQQDDDNRTEAAVIERTTSAHGGTAPQFNPLNPPPPPSQPGPYASNVRS